jgi:HEAT repeat protein
MRQRLLTCSIGFLGIALAVGALGWWQRMPLLAWYFVHRLAAAAGDDQRTWVARTATLGDAAVPPLLRCLSGQDAQACANAQAALAQIVGTAERRQSALTARLADRFAGLSAAGQTCALELATDWLAKAPVGSRVLVPATVRLLPISGRSTGSEVHRRALQLAALLLNHDCSGDERNACRELVRLTLQDPEPANRIDAVRLASTPSLSMSRQVAPLLNDSDARVRQTAMAVVGCAPEAIGTDDLLRSLHDPDADVRRLCEAALRGRGLRPQDVTLGRLITDARASVRLQVLERLRQADLEPGIWLRRLSEDPVPAVRAAAIRVAAQSHLGLRDQLEKMADRDPSPTVRQLAQHYLGRPKTQPIHDNRP